MTYTFIDDSDKKKSLASCNKQIKDCEVLIASDRFYERLVDNLLRLGIKNFSNGIKKFSERLNAYFASSNKKIGLICDDFSSQKHFGSIAEELSRMDFEIFYLKLFGSHEYETDLNNKNELLIVSDFLSYLNFFSIAIGTGWCYVLHREVKYINLFSCYYMPNFHSYYHTKEHLGRIAGHYEIMSFMNYYIVCSNKRSYEKFVEVFEKNNGHKERLLRLGYPSLDVGVELYEKQQKHSEDTIIIPAVVTNELLKEFTEDLINALLDKTQYRILYKTHNGHPELFKLEKQFCEQWKGRRNFVFYSEPNLTTEELKRSITLIESRSSLLYTYPLITGKPSIIAYPDSKWITENPNIEDNFYEEKLQIKAFCISDILDIIKCLTNEEFSLKRKQMIEDYRKNDAYCFGESSKNIANFINEYFRKYL